MPLVALDDGRRAVDLTDITHEQWHDLRAHGGRFLCPGCNLEMHPADNHVQRIEDEEIVVYKVPMFRHNPHNGQRCREMGYGNESPEHAHAKAQIKRAAERAGWKAECEVIHADRCRSDVLLTDPKTGHTHSMEVQCSPLGVADGAQRAERYAAHVDRQLWFTKGRRVHLERVLPAITTDESVAQVVGGIWTDLDADEQLVEALPAVVELWCRGRIAQTDAGADGGWIHLLLGGRDGVQSRPRSRRRTRRNNKGKPLRLRKFCESLDSMSAIERDVLLNLGMSMPEFYAARAEVLKRFRDAAYTPSVLSTHDKAILGTAGKWAAKR